MVVRKGLPFRRVYRLSTGGIERECCSMPPRRQDSCSRPKYKPFLNPLTPLKFRIMIKKSSLSLLAAIFLLSMNAFAQNRFEGFNIFLSVPEDQKGPTCTVRYVNPSTDIVIADLDTSTPMKLKSCGGTESKVSFTGGSTASMRASSTDYKWCFEGEDKMYRISFRGDATSGTLIYNWIATPNARDLGTYNVRDFGAKGDGRTDDSIAIQSAFAFMATHNGGTLNFPQGDYLVGDTSNYKGLTPPSGTIIQGVVGFPTGAYTGNVTQRAPSRITLKGTNRAIFKTGECTDRITIKDIELHAQSNENTYGYEAVGAFTSSQEINYDRVIFNNFYRGIYAHGLPITSFAWQFDYVKVNNCRFLFNRDAGIHINVRNSDWRIESSLFINAKKRPGQNGDSIFSEHSAMLLITDTFSGGVGGEIGGTFLSIMDSANITVIGCQTEAMTNTMVINPRNIPGVGDYSYPITFINNIFGIPTVFNGARNFISVGNQYDANSFKADAATRVHSTGDRFCYNGNTLGCQGVTRNFFDKATVISMSGEVGERGVPTYPTFFGTDVKFGSGVQMPTFQHNQLPAGQPNGSMIYCQNCRRSTTPCQAGGSGAPAMMVNGQWSCL